MNFQAGRNAETHGMAGDAALAMALGLAGAIGLGTSRFAYALVLPDMRQDLAWSYSEAGWMNGANALGYLVGALTAARLIGRFGAFRTMFAGAVLCVAALIACGALRDIGGLSAARLVAGVGGALAFVGGGVLVSAIAERHPQRSGFLLGLFYAGPGFGILVSGIGVPAILQLTGNGGWPMAWIGLGALSLLLLPVLATGRRAEIHRAPGTAVQAALRPMAPLLIGYFCFGAGYIAFMTFMIAFVQGHGAGPVFQSLFWSVIGLGAMASPWLWGGVLRRLGAGKAFALLIAITATGAALPLLSGSTPVLLLAAGLFGATFLSVVASTTAFVRRNYAPRAWAAGIGAMTIAFGLGQTIGPILTGWLSDLQGGLSSGLGLSAALLLAGAAIGLLQRDLTASVQEDVHQV